MKIVNLSKQKFIEVAAGFKSKSLAEAVINLMANDKKVGDITIESNTLFKETVTTGLEVTKSEVSAVTVEEQKDFFAELKAEVKALSGEDLADAEIYSIRFEDIRFFIIEPSVAGTYTLNSRSYVEADPDLVVQV